MTVKERILVLKLAEKKKKNPKFFEELEIDVNVDKTNVVKRGVKINGTRGRGVTL